MDITKNLRKLRVDRKLTQSEVSEKMGFVSHNAYSHWELGKSSPNIRDLDKLAAVFGVTISELLFGESGEQSAPTGKVEELETEIRHLKRENMLLQILAKEKGVEFPKHKGVAQPEINLYRRSNLKREIAKRGLRLAS